MDSVLQWVIPDELSLSEMLPSSKVTFYTNVTSTMFNVTIYNYPNSDINDMTYIYKVSLSTVLTSSDIAAIRMCLLSITHNSKHTSQLCTQAYVAHYHNLN